MKQVFFQERVIHTSLLVWFTEETATDRNETQIRKYLTNVLVVCYKLFHLFIKACSGNGLQAAQRSETYLHESVLHSLLTFWTET